MLGGKLRALRQKNGWTQKQIAEMLHINRSTYAYYETGATQPDLDMFRRLAILFEVSTTCWGCRHLCWIWRTSSSCTSPPCR